MTPTTDLPTLRKMRNTCEVNGCKGQMQIHSVSADGYTREWTCLSGDIAHRRIVPMGTAQVPR